MLMASLSEKMFMALKKCNATMLDVELVFGYREGFFFFFATLEIEETIRVLN